MNEHLMLTTFLNSPFLFQYIFFLIFLLFFQFTFFVEEANFCRYNNASMERERMVSNCYLYTHAYIFCLFLFSLVLLISSSCCKWECRIYAQFDWKENQEWAKTCEGLHVHLTWESDDDCKSIEPRKCFLSMKCDYGALMLLLAILNESLCQIRAYNSA